MPQAYENAGVSVEAGYEVVKRIKSHVARTNRPGVVGGIGGFVCQFFHTKNCDDVLQFLVLLKDLLHFTCKKDSEVPVTAVPCSRELHRYQGCICSVERNNSWL